MKSTKMMGFALAILLACPTLSYGQSKESDDKIYEATEEPPKYPDGEHNLYIRLGEIIDVAGQMFGNELKFTYSPKILIQFVVEKDGNLSNYRLIKKESLVIKGDEKNRPKAEEQLMAAAKKILNEKKWTPAKIGGKPVRAKHTMPIQFFEKR